MINKMPIELSFNDVVIRPGEVGLIVSLKPYRDWLFQGYDYVVSIQGIDVFFFDHELDLYNPKKEIE